MTTLSEIETRLENSELILSRADRLLDAIRVEQDALREVINDRRDKADETEDEREYIRLTLEIQALKERGYQLVGRINRVCNYADFHGKMACKFAIESLGGTFHGQPIQEQFPPMLALPDGR